MESRLDNRRKQFKKRNDDPRARREEQQLSLRRQDRDLDLQRKRCGVDVNGEITSAQKPPVISETEPSAQTVGSSDMLSRIPELRAKLLSEDPEAQFDAAQVFRRMLSIESSPPIQQVLDAGVLPRLVEFLKMDDRPRLQFESAWAVTNIASGTQPQTRAVVDSAAVPIFVRLLGCSDEEVLEQAVWALGNISGDSPVLRDFVLEANALDSLLNVFETTEKMTLLRNATWTLSNLCRGKPPPNPSVVERVIPTMARLVHCRDVDVLVDVGWGLSYLTDGPNDRIQLVVQNMDICKKLVEFLSYPQAVAGPALRAIGNIVTGNDEQTQIILDLGALPLILAFVNGNKKSTRKEACWTISNIAAGSVSQIQALIDGNVMPTILSCLFAGDHEVVKEATWAVCNATSGGTHQQADVLVRMGCIEPLCHLLGVNDIRIAVVALESLEHILKAGQIQKNEQSLKANPYCGLIEDADGVTAIEKLQDAASSELATRAYTLITTYFPFEEEEDDAGLFDAGKDKNNQSLFAQDIFKDAHFGTNNAAFNFSETPS